MTLIFKTILLLAAALTTFVAAARPPANVSRRHREVAKAKRDDCNTWPDGPDISIRNLIVQICDELGVTYTVKVAAMVTAMQESGINNLHCGVGNAFGVYQQTPGDGWGSLPQILDPDHACRAFLAVAIELNKQNPGLPPGTLAQHVQDDSAGDTYTQHTSVAEQYIRDAESELGISGSDGGDNGGGDSGGDDGSVNVESGPSKSSGHKSSGSDNSSSSSGKKCKRHHTAKRGDTCLGSLCSLARV